jgi:chemotaxis regulatin CheY-phosphate phosphatase CheZ
MTTKRNDRPDVDPSTPEGLPTLPQTLLRAYGEITGILTRLSESRVLLEQAAVDRLVHMNDKLKEVSNATETAATDIMNGLDRSAAMMDELDALAELPESSERAAAIRANVRDELLGLMVHLQFQDITSQQLAFASSVIVEIERRLAAIVKLFDSDGMDIVVPAPPPVSSGPVTFDPNATMSNATDRQSLADEIFLVNR